MQPHRIAVALAGLSLVIGCGGGGSSPSDASGDDTDAPPTPDARPDAEPEPLPVLYNPVDGTDDAIALAALQRLGAPVVGADTRCQACHTMTNAHLKQWGTYSAAAYPCLTGVDLTSTGSAQGALSCLSSLTSSGNLEAYGLGVWSAAGRLAWFDRLFHVAYPTTGDSEYSQFVADVAMPPASGELTQGGFDVVAEWFVRGQPRLDHYVPAVGPNDCTPSIGPEVAPLVADLATTGWRAVNSDSSLSMYGCAGAATPLDCMANQPRATERPYSSTWERAPGQMRLLAELPNYGSAFWTRSSADGRFVAHGGGDGAGGSTVIDLNGDHHIGVDAAYDPSFFPDNSGFIFQGSGRNTCDQSILLGHPTSISMSTSPKCASMGIGLYQHTGRAVAGDYFAISGSFVSDFGGGQDDPSAFFGPTDTAEIRPMIHNGTTYVSHPSTTIPVPNEGDAVISPSTRMMVTRQGDTNGDHIAFVLHAVDATPVGDSYDIETPTIGKYCYSGSKPGFSYDERWITYHHAVDGTSNAEAIELGFTGISDPGFAPYISQGAANIFLLDLVTGVSRRITMMKPGQFANFPHFRSDGWIYFIVKYGNNETIVGSDYALRVE
jgi:hypothetical protein